MMKQKWTRSNATKGLLFQQGVGRLSTVCVETGMNSKIPRINCYRFLRALWFCSRLPSLVAVAPADFLGFEVPRSISPSDFTSCHPHSEGKYTYRSICAFVLSGLDRTSHC